MSAATVVPSRSKPMNDQPILTNCMDSTLVVSAGRFPSSQGILHGPRHEKSPSSHSHRRTLHSSGVRKPLRSSPLAGPALQADSSTPENTAKSRPSRISSTPDFSSLLAHRSPARGGRPRTAESVQGYSSLPIPLTALQSPLKSPSSRSFSVENLVEQTNKEMRRPSSLVHPSISCPASLELRPPSSTFGDAAIGTPSSVLNTVRRPKTAPGYPPLPPSTPGPNRSSTEQIASAHSRDPEDNSWFIANPYEITPKFTRLGLASPSVVLPVSAKERKRLAHQKSKSSVKVSTARMTRAESSTKSSSSDASTSPSLASQPDHLSLPTPSLRRCSSSSSAASECIVSLQPRRNTDTLPIATASSITTIAEGDEFDLRRQHHPTSKPTISSRSVPSAFPLPKKGPKLSRFKVMSLQPIRSSGSMAKLRPAFMSDKLTADAFHLPPPSEIKLGFFTSRSGSPTASESTAETKIAELENLSSSPASRESIVKKLWKSITNWQRNR